MAGTGRPQPVLNSVPVPDGAGRGWSGLVGDVYVPYSGSLGFSGKSDVPILWIIGIENWIIGVYMDFLRPICINGAVFWIISALYG